MASEILMPRLGWSMEEGIFGEWLIKDGDAVRSGDLLFTVESDKATQEVEAFDNGILRVPPDGPKPGDVIQVGALLAYIVAAGEEAPFEVPMEAQRIAAQESPLTAEHPSSVVRRPSSMDNDRSAFRAMRATPAISPRARRVARELAVDWTQLNGSGSTGRIIERDVRAAALAQPIAVKVRATPIAQRLAEEAGLDLAELARQKQGDKIERADVEAAISARVPSTPAAALVQTGDATTVPVTRVRRLIAQRLAESAHTTAAVTLTTEADATELVALRAQFKTAFAARNQVAPSYNDLFAKLTTLALQAHPQLNATWGENEIIHHQAIHMGLAVDTEEGLLVPVMRDLQAKSLRQIATASADLIAKAQARKLSTDELQGGTFTITNLGMYGVDAFTPLINLPQCAILGIGRIVKKPAVVDDQVVPRQMVALSLTFDHRVVDGAPAARFLNTVREFVETPVLWLAGG